MIEAADFCRLAELAPFGIYLVRPDRTIIYWNKEAEHITGYTKKEMTGCHCPETTLHHMDEQGTPLCDTYCPILACMDQKKALSRKLLFTQKDGTIGVLKVHFIPLPDKNGRIKLVAEIFEKVSQLEKETPIVENLCSLAYHDSLTGLPNRMFLEALLKMRFSEFSRLHRLFAVFFADIDHFHDFNEQYGHQAGDHMLKAFARTITSSMRESDTVGRWGGEEFIGICPIGKKEDIVPLAARFHQLVSQISVDHEGPPLHITMSLGITAVQEGDTPESIIDRADRFMFAAKKKGRNTTVHDNLD